MTDKKSLNNQEEETQFLPLSEAAKKTGYTPEYLNSLSRKGVLKAKKIGRNWYTTTEWLADFLEKSEEKKSQKKEIKNNEAEEKIFFQSSEEKKLGEKEEDYWQEKNRSKFKLLAAASSLIIVFPLFFLGVYFVKSFTAENLGSEELAAQFGNDPVEVIVNENKEEIDESGFVLGENDETQDAPKNKLALSSENFRIQEISVGGEILALTASENLPLEIYDVKSESFISSKKEEEVKLVVSWKTNKPALSELAYSKNNGQNSESVKENSYGFNHSAVLTDLEPRTSYVYSISCKDKWANEKKSDFFGIYTASKPVSVFDMISNALNETFGWAFKK